MPQAVVTVKWDGELLSFFDSRGGLVARASGAYLDLTEAPWDDLCVVPANAINPSGPDGAMTLITATGDTDWPGCLLADAIGESCTVTGLQTNHRMLIGSDIHPHIHIVRHDVSDNAGACEFEARLRHLPLRGAASAWTAWIAGDTSAQPADGFGQTGLVTWTMADATYHFGISDRIHIQIRRSGLATGALVVESVDIHGQVGQLGSRREGSL
jgi:hypothetical protein